MINMKYLEEVREFLSEGNLPDIFDCSDEERRFEWLEFLETLMDIGELADENATKCIFKKQYAAAATGKALETQDPAIDAETEASE